MIHYFLILSAPLFNDHCESNIIYAASDIRTRYCINPQSAYWIWDSRNGIFHIWHFGI